MLGSLDYFPKPLDIFGTVLCAVGSSYNGPTGYDIPLAIQYAPNVETSVRMSAPKSRTGVEGEPIPLDLRLVVSERLTEHVPGGYVSVEVSLADSSVTTVTFFINREGGAEEITPDSDGWVRVSPENVAALSVKAHDDFSGTFILATRSVVLATRGGTTERVYETPVNEVAVNVLPISDGTVNAGQHLMVAMEDAGP